MLTERDTPYSGNTGENRNRVRGKSTKTRRPGGITCGRSVWCWFKQVTMHHTKTRRDQTGKRNEQRQIEIGIYRCKIGLYDAVRWQKGGGGSEFWQSISPACWGICPVVEEDEVGVDSGKEWQEAEGNLGHCRDLGGGVREVLVLELRRVVLIECLHTLISKIKNWGMIVQRSGGVRVKVMVVGGRGVIVK